MKAISTETELAVAAFKAVTIDHSVQSSTKDLVMFMLSLSPNVDIVNLVGPTGVGKSVLQVQVAKALVEQARDRMLEDPSHVPIIRTYALAAGHKQFSFKSLYVGALFALGDPFAGRRKAAPVGTAPIMRLYPGETPSTADLRMCLEVEMARRGTRVWIIDEAQHLVFGGKSGQPGDQFDVLKSIAQTAGIKLLLSGPDEMEDGLGTSPQLARRSVTVHYRRYLHTSTDDMTECASAVETLFTKMGVRGYPSVLENAPFYYAGCAGCIGILKDWMAKAYGFALMLQPDVTKLDITLEHLRQARLSARDMQIVMNDIRRAEEKLANAPTDDDYLRIVTGPASEDAKPPTARENRPKPARAKSGSIKPGTRALGARDKTTLTPSGEKS